MIAQGGVTYRGQEVTLAMRLAPHERLELAKAQQQETRTSITLLYHKPLGVLSAPPKTGGYPLAIDRITCNRCAQGPKEGKKILDQIKQGRIKLHCAGRLDVHSKGLLVLTSEVQILHALLHTPPDRFQQSLAPAKNSSTLERLEKEYFVRTKEPLSHAQQKALKSIEALEDEAILPYRFELIEPDYLRLVLQEGKKHQIRRMVQSVGAKVAKIKRVRIGPLLLGGLALDQWTLAPSDATKKLRHHFDSN